MEKCMTEKRKPRILLADDEALIRKYMKVVMTKMNCEIIGEATNGNEAVELFKQNKPDLMLLDINMPLKTGEEALKEIKQEFPDAFIIMLTSVVNSESVENCLNLGAANYILKDTPKDEMQKIIKETWMLFKKRG